MHGAGMMGVGALLAAGTAWLLVAQGWRQAALWGVGLALGLVLYQAAFSFAGGFRLFLTQRRGAMPRAVLVMLGVSTLLILPAVAVGNVFGAPVRGLVFPVGVASVLGAWLFGVGMQLGGGCASGTLYAAGAGSGRTGLTLLCFIGGATAASWQSQVFAGWPAWPGVALAERFGLAVALAGSVAVLAAAYALVLRVERRRYGRVEGLRWRGGSLWRGPWPVLWGAVALAGLNFLILCLAGRPWAITAAFPLWGSKLVAWLGWDDPIFWLYWDDPTRSEALLRPLLADRTTVMDLGMIAGAALAAMLAGRWALGWRLNLGEVAASAVGGVLLGVGAVLASGCNISAWVSGTASGSLHGWAWIFPALLGNWVGVQARGWFKLERA